MNDCTCLLRPWEAGDRPYRVPTPAGCDVEEARYYHDDLASMAVPELAVERHRVIGALAGDGYLVIEQEWLNARFGAVIAEQSRRRPTARPAARPHAVTDEWRRPSFETTNNQKGEWGDGR